MKIFQNEIELIVTRNHDYHTFFIHVKHCNFDNKIEIRLVVNYEQDEIKCDAIKCTPQKLLRLFYILS